jgi:hypothetical protein
MNLGVSGFWVWLKAGVVWWTICPALVMILIRLLVKVWSDMILLCLTLERNKRGDFFVGVLFGVGLASLVLCLVWEIRLFE